MEEADGRHFLVMELVEGLTLGECIARGPMTLERALSASRDRSPKRSKPRTRKASSIAISSPRTSRSRRTTKSRCSTSGSRRPRARRRRRIGRESPTIANSPTLTAMGTQAGMILGTASYMSPEQARGMSGDHRSDVFSFGVVLYEMLTGRQPFQGETVSDVLASVLARDPDLAALPPDLSPRLSELVERCLEKQPKRRWQAMGDVRHELEVIAKNPRGRRDAAAVGSRRTLPATAVAPRLVPLAALALGAAATAAAFMAIAPGAGAARRHRLRDPGAGRRARHDALAGRPPRRLWHRGDRQQRSRLWIRSLASFEIARRLPAPKTSSAADGRMAHVPRGRPTAVRLPLPTGRPDSRSTSPPARRPNWSSRLGAVVLLPGGWSRDGTILYRPAQPRSTTWRRHLADRRLGRRAGAADRAQDRELRIEPSGFLPDGRRFLYAATHPVIQVGPTPMRDPDRIARPQARRAGHDAAVQGGRRRPSTRRPDICCSSGAAV